MFFAAFQTYPTLNHKKNKPGNGWIGPVVPE
jgi:hypothetical protein